MMKNLKAEIIRLKNKYYNTLWYQKKWAKRTIEKNSLEYSYVWGNPDTSNGDLGNYLKIKSEYLIPNVKDKVVLELGCLDGKWSQFIVPIARKTILVDLDKSIIPLLTKRLGGSNFDFYETKGYELKGINNNSVDFIFSMDTLVRVKKSFIKKYFIEFSRVLKKEGKLLIHLPCNKSKISRERGFTDISEEEIIDLIGDTFSDKVVLDFDTIKHGVLLVNK